MVVFCPNIGILSAVVLSLVPLMRPFAWQSLLLPILPVQDKMLDLLEAPVPFILGVKVGVFLHSLTIGRDTVYVCKFMPTPPFGHMRTYSLSCMRKPSLQAYSAAHWVFMNHLHGVPFDY